MNLWWTAILLGLAGSFHCGVMCGPLMLAVSRSCQLKRMQIAYHSGRVATYCVIGLLLGSIGGALAVAGFQRWISVLAGLLILGVAFGGERLRIFRGLGRLLNGLRSCFRSLLEKGTLSSRFALGALNGLLPCGLVYVAAAGAAAMGSSIGGIGYMAMFGLGTFPMLYAVALVGNRVSFARKLGPRIISISLALVGLTLVLRGLELGIPYLSPAPGQSCH